MLIFLTGFMGSGKSHLGRELAGMMKYKFVDTDALIEKKKRKTIAQLFASVGEAGFREIERKTLAALLKESKTVISTGGGMPCFNNNMEAMKEKGLTVYLQAGLGFLFHRLVHQKKERPLISNLSDIELMEFISGTLIKRIPFYEQADIIVPADTITAEKLLEKVKKAKNSK